MNLRSMQQEDPPPGNSGSFSPFDAYEVSWRARAEEVALHLSGDTPRIWVPRSCQAGLGDLAGGIIERFMGMSSGDPCPMPSWRKGKNRWSFDKIWSCRHLNCDFEEWGILFVEQYVVRTTRPG